MASSSSTAAASGGAKRQAANKGGRGGKRSAKKQQVRSGRIYILATFNNTLVLVTDGRGNKLCQSSAGACGQKGSRKGTPYAATMACEAAIQTAIDTYGIETVEVYVKGPGPGRDAAVTATKRLRVRKLEDITPVPHNGVRPPKKRRV